MSHIQHIVVVVMENHPYDNYFGTYCLAVSRICPTTGDGIPNGTCIPYNPAQPALGCVKPYPFTKANWTVPHSMPHDWGSSHQAWNNGSMNGFYMSQHAGILPFGYYNGTTAPLYWDIAEQYGLGDQFFSSVLSYSLPNHWYLVAGGAPNVSLKNSFSPKGGGAYATQAAIYLNESNQMPTIADELINSSVSWNYYEKALGNYSQASIDTVGHFGRAYDFWNPLAAKGEDYNTSFRPHFVNNTQFFSDASNGTLPQVSYLIPARVDSDHPPENSTLAQGWVSSVVDAVESSPDWNSTALFITWDEYGGFYDHVSPPTVSGNVTTGFRVPLLVISPWAREDHISANQTYFESLLHLIEWRFHLPCSSAIDCNAPLPLDFFNFNMAPRAPMLFPTNVSNASYPMALQKRGQGSQNLPLFTPPEEYLNLTPNETDYDYND
jgi:phospholipase C